MDDAAANTTDSDVNHVIPDLGTLPLDKVLSAEDTVLNNALRRVHEELGRPGENYAAHGTTP
ncbi:FXSXX-COOH protein [Krasilnikovia cinnamomea]|uniref:FXSXX-COOH protein n=1 Tax=Krasilnikovia cinnamomea TaxID=349313 RepID=A0A4Q7ZMV2_9ACTN|nr:FxSxx-COOH cyclophane-containing RiPP peptide [Krasilnikovia cinnamomea]RZU52348.1 FXSXX-COOH protein [Krasilnikovia cinnamomea]